MDTEKRLIGRLRQAASEFRAESKAPPTDLDDDRFNGLVTKLCGEAGEAAWQLIRREAVELPTLPGAFKPWPGFTTGTADEPVDVDYPHIWWLAFVGWLAKTGEVLSTENVTTAALTDLPVAEWIIRGHFPARYLKPERLKPEWPRICRASESAISLLLGHSSEATTEQDTSPEPPDNVFRKEGKSWRLKYDGTTVRLPDLKGLHYIAALLNRPDPEKPVAVQKLELEASSPRPTSRDEHTVSRMSGNQRSAEGISDGYLGDPVLDDEAIETFNAAIEQKREKLGQTADPAEQAEIKEEIEQIDKMLKKSAGLGGKARKMPDAVEKARIRVTNNINRAIKHISDDHPSLAAHLKQTIKTGRTCFYLPEKRVDWDT